MREALLGCKSHGTRADGAVTLEPVYCLGAVRAVAGRDGRRAAVRPRDARAARRHRGRAGAERMTSRDQVYVPRDAAALAVGADEVAAALQAQCAARGVAVQIVRNGSRGLFWLEPLVEVDTPAGRIAYGPVAVDDVPALFDAGLLHGGDASAAPRADRGDSLPGEAGAPDLRAHRRHRSAVARTTTQAHDGWAGLRARAGASMAARPSCSR